MVGPIVFLFLSSLWSPRGAFSVSIFFFCYGELKLDNDIPSLRSQNLKRSILVACMFFLPTKGHELCHYEKYEVVTSAIFV
jgi:hypothetical protein